MPDTFATVLAASHTFGTPRLGLEVVHGAFTSREDATERKWHAHFPVGEHLAGKEGYGISAADDDRAGTSCTDCQYQKVIL